MGSWSVARAIRVVPPPRSRRIRRSVRPVVRIGRHGGLNERHRAVPASTCGPRAWFTSPNTRILDPTPAGRFGLLRTFRLPSSESAKSQPSTLRYFSHSSRCQAAASARRKGRTGLTEQLPLVQRCFACKDPTRKKEYNREYVDVNAGGNGTKLWLTREPCDPPGC